METLIAIPQDHHHHQCCDRKWCRGSKKFRSFDSRPKANFQAINCPAYQYGDRIVATKPYLSPKFPPHENRVFLNRVAKRSSVAVPIRSKIDGKEKHLYYSDLWAGPTYSNSPPPSSVPIPKFSLRRKRTVSLDISTVVSEIDLHPIAKSAPASPTRDWRVSPDNLFEASDSATKTLRLILNLDISDE